MSIIWDKVQNILSENSLPLYFEIILSREKNKIYKRIVLVFGTLMKPHFVYNQAYYI